MTKPPNRFDAATAARFAAVALENIVLVPPIKYTLEQAMEFIADDELVEVTPTQIRLRKRALKEHERKRAGREEETAE